MAEVGAAQEGRRGWVRIAQRGACLLAAAAALAGCGARLSLRVPPGAIAELPLERKLTLLDAENELLAAQDARETQEERWVRARDGIEDARRHRSEAEALRARAKRASGPLEAWDAAVREAEARVRWADADDDLQAAELKASDGLLLVAQARYELARAAEVEAAALPGSAGVKAADYQLQVEKLQRAAAERVAAAAKQRAEAQQVKEKWQAARAELQRASGGGQGSAWTP